jgi:hypothetical protein
MLMFLHTHFKGERIERLNILTYNNNYNCSNYNVISTFANKYNNSKHEYLS